MSDKLKEVKEFLINGDGIDKKALLNDIVSETFFQLNPNLQFMCADEIGLEWGDTYITDLDTYSNHFYNSLIKKIINVIDSFE